MLAWHLNSSPGGYSLGEVTTPEPGATEVRVSVRASALNHIDHWMTVGRPRPPSFPHVAGSDGAGVIDAIGSAVTGWQVGDDVVISTAITSDDAARRLGVDNVLDPSMELLGEHRWGCHGAHVVVPALALRRRPHDLSWTDAAAYPCAMGTAWRMLRRARLGAGETVIVTGAGGGVAIAAVQLAIGLGANVFVTSRDPAKIDRAIALGAAGGFDSAGPYPVPADVIVDSIGPAIWEASVDALVPGGRFVTCGGTSGQHIAVSVPRLFFLQHELIGSTLASYEEFGHVTDLVSAGLRPVIDSVIPFAEYPAALERLRSGSQFGKIVLDHTD